MQILHQDGSCKSSKILNFSLDKINRRWLLVFARNQSLKTHNSRKSSLQHQSHCMPYHFHLFCTATAHPLSRHARLSRAAYKTFNLLSHEIFRSFFPIGNEALLSIGKAASLQGMILLFGSTGLYKVEYSPPAGGGGIKSKGLEIGKKIKSQKRRKKKNFEDLTLLVVPNGSI